MARYEITTPGGKRYELEGPEGATRDQLWAATKDHVRDEANKIDLDQDEGAIRKAVEDIEFDDVRQDTYRRWADKYVDKETQEGEVGDLFYVFHAVNMVCDTHAPGEDGSLRGDIEFGDFLYLGLRNATLGDVIPGKCQNSVSVI